MTVLAYLCKAASYRAAFGVLIAYRDKAIGETYVPQHKVIILKQELSLKWNHFLAVIALFAEMQKQQELEYFNYILVWTCLVFIFVYFNNLTELVVSWESSNVSLLMMLKKKKKTLANIDTLSARHEFAFDMQTLYFFFFLRDLRIYEFSLYIAKSNAVSKQPLKHEFVTVIKYYMTII